ncbi:MAG: hypothetical protein JRI55_10245 [Deltaproteobacteria bacterium]|nr:hypothetical protein [Deltaproteobacteria bacterium]
MAESKDQVEAEREKARRKRLVIAVVAVVVLIPTVAMVIVNHIESEVPPPLWTPAALPIPAEQDNGWSLIADYHSTTISGIDLEPLDKLMGAAKSGTPLAELGRLLSPARSVASKIGKHTKVCDAAFARQRMVVPCLAVGTRACSVEPLEICSRIVLFGALDDAARGSPRATGRLSNVLRQLTDAAANSPHPWVQSRSLVLLRKGIHQAAAVIRWRRVDTEKVRESLHAVSETSLPMEHFVIGSYLLKHQVLRQLLEENDTWLLDEGDIMRGFNAPFEVAAQGKPLPPPPDYTAGLFWWFNNPIGKKMLDALTPGADADFEKTTELRASVFERRKEALELK